ncbi:N-acetyltransferase, partial [Enterococcus faecalis]
VAPNVGPFFEELVQELEKQAALWGMKEVFLVMDDKQSVGLNYFNRQGIVPAFSEQYLVFQRETYSQALAKLTLLRPQAADLHSLARLLEGTPLPEDLQRTLIYKENN